MIHWSKIPFIRFIVPFIAGILLCYCLNFPFTIPYSIISALIGLLIFVSRLTRKLIFYKWRWIFGLTLNVILITFGYKLTENSFELRRSDHFSNASHKISLYTAKVIDQPVEREKSMRMVLQMISIRDEDKNLKCSGKIICYLKKDAQIIPEYGDIIIFFKHPLRTEKSGNPGEFDYAGYLENRGIYHSLYLNRKEFNIISGNNGNRLKAFANNIRNKILIQLRNYNSFSESEYSIAAAILTGYDDLKEDQREAYSNAGVIHILSVSGLHVGVIYLMAQLLTSVFSRKSRFLFIQPVFIISLIWFYAIITGMSVPVLRASLMFSLILLGKALRLQNNNFNTLAAAAFLLLMLNPRSLLEVGFQLSFGAVAGIMLFKAPITKLWNPKNPVLVKVWDLVAISISAQILITPLILYYFHKLPVYFVLANLIAVPLSGLIIYTGVIFVISTFIPLAGKIFGYLLMSEIRFLNNFINFVDHLPGSVIENIHITFFNSVVLLLLLVSVAIFLISAQKKYLLITMLCVLILSIGASMRNIRISNQRIIVFHKINQHTLISFINKEHQTILTDSVLIENITKANYQLEGLAAEAGIRTQQVKCLKTINIASDETLPQFYLFNGKRIVFLHGNSLLPKKIETKINADYVLLCGNSVNSLSLIKRSFPGALIIADNSLSYRKLEELEDESKTTGIPFYSVKNDGALVVDFD